MTDRHDKMTQIGEGRGGRSGDRMGLGGIGWRIGIGWDIGYS